MKIYNLPPSEGLRVITAYQCDECGDLESGEDLPESWLEEGNNHYCLNCQQACLNCTKLFSTKSTRDYFYCGICENCMENFNKFLDRNSKF